MDRTSRPKKKKKTQQENSNLLKKILFIFRERRREGERKEEKYQYVVASHMLPTRDLVRNTGMCPDWELNWRPFALQAGTQSTKPHQPGLVLLFIFCFSTRGYIM